MRIGHKTIFSESILADSLSSQGSQWVLPANICPSRREGCKATDATRKLLQGRSDPGCDRYQCLRRQRVRYGTQYDAEGERTADGDAGASRTNAKPNSWVIQCLQPRKVPASLKRVPSTDRTAGLAGDLRGALASSHTPHSNRAPPLRLFCACNTRRWVCVRIARR